MTPQTPESLAALDTKELRSIYAKVVGYGPGSRSREALVAGILAADTGAQEPVAEVEPTVVEVEPEAAIDQESDAPVEASIPEVEAPVQAEPTAALVAPIARVRLLGYGENEGSEVVCPLLSLSATTAEVRFVERKLKFRVSDGAVATHRKGWETSGWRLDLSTLPAPREMSESEIASAPLRDLSVEQLQALYLHTVGRETDATNREYLVWRIRQARAGKGVATSGSGSPRSTEDSKIIQLRLPISTMDALDAAWRKLGYANRNAFFRQGLAKLLQEHGEDSVAKLIV